MRQFGVYHGIGGVGEVRTREEATLEVSIGRRNFGDQCWEEELRMRDGPPETRGHSTWQTKFNNIHGTEVFHTRNRPNVC